MFKIVQIRAEECNIVNHIVITIYYKTKQKLMKFNYNTEFNSTELKVTMTKI